MVDVSKVMFRLNKAQECIISAEDHFAATLTDVTQQLENAKQFYKEVKLYIENTRIGSPSVQPAGENVTIQLKMKERCENMPGYESKALLLSVLRFSQETSDPRKTEKFIEDLLIADGYVPESRKQNEEQKPQE